MPVHERITFKQRDRLNEDLDFSTGCVIVDIDAESRANIDSIVGTNSIVVEIAATPRSIGLLNYNFGNYTEFTFRNQIHKISGVSERPGISRRIQITGITQR